MLEGLVFGKSKHLIIKLLIRLGAGKIVKSLISCTDYIIVDEFGSLAGSIFGMFHAAFPVEHSPISDAVFGELAEYFLKVNLPISDRTKSARPVNPGLIASVHAAASGGIKLGIFNVTHITFVVINISQLQIIRARQHQMAALVQNFYPRMVAGGFQKAFIGNAFVQVFAGMTFVANVYAALFNRIQNRLPFLGKLIESGFYKAGRPLWPRINGVPHQGTAKGAMGIESQITAGPGGILKLPGSPFLPFFRLSMQLFRGKSIKELIISRVYCYQLANNMRTQLGDHQAGFFYDAFNFISIGLAFSGLLNIDTAGFPNRNLHAFIS